MKKTRTMTTIGMLGAIAAILMLLEIPVPLIPPFYKLDFSEVPVLIGSFALGPVAGVLIELLKIILNLFVGDGTTTGFVGEFANFVMGCAFCIPAALVYRKHKSKKGAFWGLVVGVVTTTIVACFVNTYIMLPLYAKTPGMSMDIIIGMGTGENENIRNMLTFVLFAVVPINLLKGITSSVIVMLVYKKISKIIKGQFKI